MRSISSPIYSAYSKVAGLVILLLPIANHIVSTIYSACSKVAGLVILLLPNANRIASTIYSAYSKVAGLVILLLPIANHIASTIYSVYSKAAGLVILLLPIANHIMPESAKYYFYSKFSNFFEHLFNRVLEKPSPFMIIVVDEPDIMRNQIYTAAEVYLQTKIRRDAKKLKASQSTKQENIHLSLVNGQKVVDFYKGFKVNWRFMVGDPDREKGMGRRYFEVTFEEINKDTVLDEYFPFVLGKAIEIKENKKAVKLYSKDCVGGNGGGRDLGCINLNHPATFDKLAMDLSLKQAIIEDLDRFLRRKDYYKEVGKAWKRGYLLYGPPGTGKSSLIAAMANYLKFDVYDLELASLHSNSQLRKILLSISNKSIIVIEDIDCSAPMRDMERNGDSNSIRIERTQLTLSGLLNFIDGLWSTCGDERIIILTTNYKDKLDPALLRPGRMDMHIHMGYCTPEGFDTLALNYLGIRDHPRLFSEIKGLIREIEITPAEIAEYLLRSEDVDCALEGLLYLLKQKKNEQGKVLDGSDVKENKSNGDGGVQEDKSFERLFDLLKQKMDEQGKVSEGSDVKENKSNGDGGVQEDKSLEGLLDLLKQRKDEQGKVSEENDVKENKSNGVGGVQEDKSLEGLLDLLKQKKDEQGKISEGSDVKVNKSNGDGGVQEDLLDLLKQKKDEQGKISEENDVKENKSNVDGVGQEDKGRKRTRMSWI